MYFPSCVCRGRAQGVDVPTETSTTTDDTCGQAITFPYYVRYSTKQPVPSPPVPIPSPSPSDATGGAFPFANIPSWNMCVLFRNKATPFSTCNSWPFHRARASWACGVCRWMVQ